MKKFMLFATAMIIALMPLGNTNAFALEQDKETCISCQNSQGDILKNRERTIFLNEALENKIIKEKIRDYSQVGYEIDLAQSEVGKSEKGEITTGLLLLDSKGDFVYLFFYHSTGEVLDLNTDTLNELLEQQKNEVQPQMCGACLVTCLAVAGVPALFIPCMILCGGGFC